MQREVYPALLLFPAARKKAILYEGDLAVRDIIKFVAEQGSNSQHLINQNGNVQLRLFIAPYYYSYHPSSIFFLHYNGVHFCIHRLVSLSNTRFV